MNLTALSKRTMAHVAIEREIAAIATEEDLHARCVQESPNFTVRPETFESRTTLVARWTDRVGESRALQTEVDARRTLLVACLYRMMVRDIS